MGIRSHISIYGVEYSVPNGASLRKCPAIVPGFCGANLHSSSWLVNFGTAPDGAGDSPKFTAILVKLAPLYGVHPPNFDS